MVRHVFPAPVFSCLCVFGLHNIWTAEVWNTKAQRVASSKINSIAFWQNVNIEVPQIKFAIWLLKSNANLLPRFWFQCTNMFIPLQRGVCLRPKPSFAGSNDHLCICDIRWLRASMRDSACTRDDAHLQHNGCVCVPGHFEHSSGYLFPVFPNPFVFSEYAIYYFPASRTQLVSLH